MRPAHQFWRDSRNNENISIPGITSVRYSAVKDKIHSSHFIANMNPLDCTKIFTIKESPLYVTNGDGVNICIGMRSSEQKYRERSVYIWEENTKTNLWANIWGMCQHDVKMNLQDHVKRLFLYSPDAEREMGLPRLRWWHGVQQHEKRAESATEVKQRWTETVGLVSFRWSGSDQDCCARDVDYLWQCHINIFK